MTNPFEHFKRYTIAEIGNAPTSPGLYAWYGVVVAGAPDWVMDLHMGQDRGEQNSRRLLKNHTARYRGPDLNITATGGFSTSWSGRIQDSSNQVLQELLEPTETPAVDEDDDAPAPKLRNTLSSPEARKLLFKALKQSAPVFAAPLYIGVAENLLNRLTQHKRRLLKLWDICNKEPGKLVALQNTEYQGEFSVRAIERGFSPESVEVWVLALEHLNEDKLSDAQLRTTAEALEWLLNRWHRPPLGRR